MSVTDNGWPALAKAPGPTFVAAGEGRPHDVASPELAVLFAYVVMRWHTEIEPVTACFGGRTVAQNAAVNGAPQSNHISYTAIDVNGAKHPYELRGGRWSSGFTATGLATLRDILAQTQVLQWGGDFDSPYRDAMHVQVAQRQLGYVPGGGPRIISDADVARAAAKVSGWVKAVQASVGAKPDGVAGPGYVTAVKAWQRSRGLSVDGVFGRMSQTVAGWGTTVPVQHGVDVSEHQTVADWQALAPQRVIAKASEGLDYKDPSYDAHCAAARAMGVFGGAYHFVWLQYDPLAACANFLKAAGLATGERAIIDFEPYGVFAGGVPEKDWPGWVCSFILALRAARPGEPIDIYLNDDMATRLFNAATPAQAKLIRTCGLWKARYDSHPGDTYGWPGIVGWQYSGSAPVDRNVFYGTPASPGGGKPTPKPPAKGDPKVKRIQRIVGADPDGIRGPKTVAAIKAFQRRLNTYGHAGLKVDGAYGPATEKARAAFCDGVLGPDTIRLWQHNAGTPVDGVISRPSALIRKVQADDSEHVRPQYRAKADGLLGKATWAMLRDLMGISVTSSQKTTIRHLQGRLLRGDY